MFNRLNRALQNALDPDKTGSSSERQPTIESLLPGDVVSTWDYGDCVVEAVLDCREDLNGREIRWRWNLLDERRLLETAPDAHVLYTQQEVLYQDSAGFETLTSDPDQGGVLKAFEARVRQGTAARNPVYFEHDGRTFRILSTGTFLARPVGTSDYPRAEVWRDVHPTNAGENVYFEMEELGTDAEESEETVVLGVWTTHIALYFGKKIKAADISTIYPGQNQATGPTR